MNKFRIKEKNEKFCYFIQFPNFPNVGDIIGVSFGDEIKHYIIEEYFYILDDSNEEIDWIELIVSEVNR